MFQLPDSKSAEAATIGNFIKRRLQHRCFPVKFAKFLRTVLKNICERPLLNLFACFQLKLIDGDGAFCEAVNCFRKKLHLRCLNGFWIRLWVKIGDSIRMYLFLLNATKSGHFSERYRKRLKKLQVLSAWKKLAYNADYISLSLEFRLSVLFKRTCSYYVLIFLN